MIADTAAAEAAGDVLDAEYLPAHIKSDFSAAQSYDRSSMRDLGTRDLDAISAAAPYLAGETPKARLISAAGAQATVIDAYKRLGGVVVLDVSYIAMSGWSAQQTQSHALTSVATPNVALGTLTTELFKDGVRVDEFTVTTAQGPACGISAAPQACSGVVTAGGILLALACAGPQAPAACGPIGLASAVLSPVICAFANLCPLYTMSTTTMECVFNGCKVGAQSYSPASYARSVTVHFFYMSGEGYTHAIFKPGQSLGNTAGTSVIRWVADAYSYYNAVCQAPLVQVWYTVNWNDGTNYLFMDQKSYPKAVSNC